MARQVTFPRLNVLTPFSTALMISSFDFSKAVCRSWVQAKSVLGFSRFLKGSMMSDWEKAKLHWMTRPGEVLDVTEELLRWFD